MKKITFSFLATSLLIFSGCGTVQTVTPSPTSTTQNPPTSTTSSSFHGTQLAYIKNLYSKNGTYFLDVNYAEMYSGEDAIQAAMRDTGCSRDRVTNGDCEQASLNNDYYISPPDPKYITLPISSNVQIFITPQAQEVPVSFTQFRDKLSEPELAAAPFILELKNGVIMKITQQYLP